MVGAFSAKLFYGSLCDRVLVIPSVSYVKMFAMSGQNRDIDQGNEARGRIAVDHTLVSQADGVNTELW